MMIQWANTKYNPPKNIIILIKKYTWGEQQEKTSRKSDP